MKQSVTKLLYTNSGGRCALCKSVIIQKKSDGSQYHTSEVAHIRGKKPEALRHDSTITKEEMDDISNLIVLCSNCHTMIDKNDTDYTVENLYRLKEDHEFWVRIQLGRETSDGFQVDLVDCVHTEESGFFIYHMDLKLTNKTETTMRIDNISILDDDRKLEFIGRGQTSPSEAKVEIRGKLAYPWRCFCKGNSKIEKDMIELTLVISRRGKREFRKQISSMLVDRGNFPNGNFITLIDW
ncbi:MAG: HNH endonuclease [Candidatus Thorarchaeota archaeon]|nr:MAG: HNH endonuclease [Candidatus Thorarchaeota archaeon]